MDSSPALARRSLLVTAALAVPALVSGCAAGLTRGIGALGTPPRPRPDVAVVDEAIARERLLVARYRAALASGPVLETELAPILAEHEAHLAALSARLVEPRPGGPPHPGGRPSKAPAPPAPASAALAWLAGAESAAAAALLRDLPTATPSLAQLMASIAASETTHAALLSARRGAA